MPNIFVEIVQLLWKCKFEQMQNFMSFRMEMLGGSWANSKFRLLLWNAPQKFNFHPFESIY